MIALGLDSSGAYCSAALVDGTSVLASQTEDLGRGHAERLAPMVWDVLRHARVDVPQIERIIVCAGPGSFTGVRVALSFAKGLALPTRCPVIGMPAHEVWAAEHDPDGRQHIVTISDVRRGQLCWSQRQGGEFNQLNLTQSQTQARAAIAELGPDVILEDVRLDARILAWLGLDCDPDDYPPMPIYARPPDAKLSQKKSARHNKRPS